jgi:mRNA interferase HigB
MHVVSLKKLREFWQRHGASEQALRTWYHEACHASWRSFAEIREQYRSADCLPGNRVVFDIKGNHYRLIAKIHYNSGRLFIRFVGTHAEYDKIHAEII